tara:strand:- start:116 stop:736 length:621 start_codon:yes stop_codon:yes gene_type:complete
MKFRILIFFILFTSLSNAQSEKDLLLKKDIIALVEEMEFMYGYDQTLREYIIFKTFDKGVTDSIEKLPDSLRHKEISKRRFKSDSLARTIWKDYINPKDAIHTERLIEITRKYGFPNIKRIRKYYKDEFIDPEFSPAIIFVHAPEKFWKDLKILMKNELEEGRIDQCTYGHMLWHFTGRKSLKPMLENGFEMVEKNGREILMSTCD